ncbi:MAG: hypothetical protein PHP50_02320 [Lachnospiraceae bacterium]|nr:hypothetical protein [Lachnospiraceae bacterium]
MNKREKVRKISVRAKILGPAIGLMVLVCLILGMNSYARINNAMIALGVSQAETAARVAANVIDADHLTEAIEAGEGSEAYESM